MAKRKHRSEQHWLNRDFGGMPGWGLVLSALFMLGVAGMWVWSESRPEPVPQFTALPQVSATPSPSDEPPVAVFLGDSFTEGTGADDAESGFPYLVAAEMGWAPLVLGEGGTGFVADGPADGSFAERSALPDRVPAVVAREPEIVVVAAGLNDADQQRTSEVAAAVDDTFGQLAAGLPDATVYVIGPFWPTGFPNDEVLAVRDAVQAGAAEYGFRFIDPIAGEWITGLRDKSDGGNNVEYIGEDTTHPTQAGHAYLAERIVAEIQGTS